MVKSNKRRDEERRAAAAARVAEMQREQALAERRRRSITISAVVVAVVVVIVGVFVVVQLQKKAPTVAASGVGGSTADYGFVVGKADAPATLVAYEDFQCPICKGFEGLDGPTIQKYITEGKLKVEFRPIAILDGNSLNEYSTRSLNAAACVRNYSTADVFKTFHDLLYKNQPDEHTAGPSNAQLVTFANQAMRATKPAVATCINNEVYKNWTSSATDAASRAGISGTPTLILNGQQMSESTWQRPADFTSALDAAVASGTKK